MGTIEVVALILAGLMVGFINTLAGGGSIISLSLLMVLGLPPNVANGTNRIAIIIQNIMATASFRQQKVLVMPKSLYLGIPAVVGSVAGALIAVELSEDLLRSAMGVIMLFMLVFILYNPKKWLNEDQAGSARGISLKQVVIFFFIGMYGGFIQVGVGYLLLAALVVGAGFDLVKSNAAKVLVILMYLPFSLVVFLLNDDVNWSYGLVMTIGNVTGAFIASRLAVKKGTAFIRYVIIAVILLTAGHLFGLYDFQALFDQWISRPG
ncbi:MAG: sulfite exporter TauE/SafE family protein [Bacteroidales bacterium]